ncbi:MAG TPA: hypothetical protein VF145_08370, partial [Chitinophagaceae bacterium]
FGISMSVEFGISAFGISMLRQGYPSKRPHGDTRLMGFARLDDRSDGEFQHLEFQCRWNLEFQHLEFQCYGKDIRTRDPVVTANDSGEPEGIKLDKRLTR